MSPKKNVHRALEQARLFERLVHAHQFLLGLDRQVRGRLLAVLRDADGPVPVDALEQAWQEPVQRARALDGLVADGLVDPLPDGRFGLPTRAAPPAR